MKIERLQSGEDGDWIYTLESKCLINRTDVTYLQWTVNESNSVLFLGITASGATQRN